MTGIPMLLLSAGSIIAVLFFVTYASQKHNLNSIKDKTVGNGQHGTARWATKQEIHRTYHHVPFTPEAWRAAAKERQQPTANGKPLPQGIVLGCQGGKKTTTLVDSDDVHVLMIGASGVGKTAYFLYPNLEYACASGMSFLSLDTKGDLARNYGAIARDIYHYRISVVDLREPTRSDGNNLLTLINRYMDEHRENTKEISAKAKAEKYAKILAKTIINPEGSDHGQNAYFYDAAEGLLASVVLLLSEFLPLEETEGYETRHIASVFQLVQELLMQGQMGGNQFQELMQLLPADHKAKWLAGSALTASDQAMNSIMSTVLSKLNAFLDTELEQVLCFDGGIDAELFVQEKCAIFLILPEEDATKNFVASLMIQNLARELFSVANEHGGKLPNRAVFFCDELGTMPPFDKSVSRFARNTKDCLEITRELKALGISVVFEEQNIDTSAVSGEMLTAIFAACAQAESESISKNMRWSYQKRMQSGTFIPPYLPYGYIRSGDSIVTEPNQAKVVKEIFRKYLSGISTEDIAKTLREEKVPCKNGKYTWDSTSIRYILTNEKYTGDSIWQKYYTTNTLPFRNIKNDGSVDSYFAPDTHPAIISEEEFRQANCLLQSRAQRVIRRRAPDAPYREKLICGCCGSFFRRKIDNGVTYWVCIGRDKKRTENCGITQIPEAQITQAFLRCYYQLKHEGQSVLTELQDNLFTIRSRQMLWHPDVIELNKQISNLTSQSHMNTSCRSQLWIWRHCKKMSRNLKIYRKHLLRLSEGHNSCGKLSHWVSKQSKKTGMCA